MMNLEEIKQQYDALVQSKIDEYIPKIDEKMIWAYKKIKEKKQIKLTEYEINRGDKFNEQLRESIILKLQEYYFENWTVTSNIKKGDKEIIFTLKDNPEPIEEITEPLPPQTEKNEENSVENNRFGMMDL